jgi:hypothetical protein
LNAESTLTLLADVFERSDLERALALTRQGRDLARRCNVLLDRISRSGHHARAVTVLAPGTRYYKRLNNHVPNLPSSVTMPLHKVDYYDEKSLMTDASRH